ncbi:MAG: alpha/beta hydrolase [Steroidobacteraceae bacterium]|nr:alpha/beta hydrolase [Steroidobacteraceae bacterium]
MKLPVTLRRTILAATLILTIPGALAATVPTAEPAGETIELWPGGAPGGERVTVQEQSLERQGAGPLRDRIVQHTTRPLITIFRARGKANDVTLLIVPGGGYQRVVIDKEGFEAADWFAQRGFAAAVLRYRLPADGWAAGADAPVHDAMRAMRLLRRLPTPTGSPAPRIGALGYSAGGHLVARLITEPSLTYPRRDVADDLEARPDFAVLMYPVIHTTGEYAHAGSAAQLVSGGVNAADLARYSPDRNVSAGTPRTLLVHAADDATVAVENSQRMYDALRKAGVRSELHVFDRGGHGFGLRSIAGRTVAIWPTLVENWALNETPP